VERFLAGTVPLDNRPASSIDRATVRRIIVRVYPGDRGRDILNVLDQYGTEPHESERDRVQLAILKLCEERSLAGPSALVDAAKRDYRDVLAMAEYPLQSKLPPGVVDAATLAARRADRDQYLRWLNAK